MQSSIKAPAKINLSLHVGPPKANGRHDLISLIAFADGAATDTLIATPANHFSLAVEGPFAVQTGPARDNLILKAARAMQASIPNDVPALAFKLIKNLPCAAGMGGGSADAAAALHLIMQAHGGETARDAAYRSAPELGGDVLSCLYGVPGLMQGEGEQYEPVLSVPPLAALLVNAGQACPTGAVFKQYDTQAPNQLPVHPLPPAGRAREADFIAWLEQNTQNSLEQAAIQCVPEIADVLDRLKRLPGARLVRMSGSGATCYVLFDRREESEQGAKLLQADHPDWWVCPTYLGRGD